MNKENFILQDVFNKALSYKEFEKAKADYLELLDINKYAIKESETIYELIDNIKRSPEKIGPYQHISIFEALNRIGTDLVLLSGATKLFKEEIHEIKPKSIQLRMGTNKGFDIEVKVEKNKIIYGEAFNAAESFCKIKMRQAIHKLIDENPDNKAKEVIIFMNEEVEKTIENYENKKENKSKIKIHRIYCNKIK